MAKRSRRRAGVLRGVCAAAGPASATVNHYDVARYMSPQALMVC